MCTGCVVAFFRDSEKVCYTGLADSRRICCVVIIESTLLDRLDGDGKRYVRARYTFT